MEVNLLEFKPEPEVTYKDNSHNAYWQFSGMF